MNTNKKGFYFLGLAFLPLIIICLLWASSVYLIIRLAGKNGFDMLANNAKLTPKRFFVLAVIVLI